MIEEQMYDGRTIHVLGDVFVRHSRKGIDAIDAVFSEDDDVTLTFGDRLITYTFERSGNSRLLATVKNNHSLFDRWQSPIRNIDTVDDNAEIYLPSGAFTRRPTQVL